MYMTITVLNLIADRLNSAVAKQQDGTFNLILPSYLLSSHKRVHELGLHFQAEGHKEKASQTGPILSDPKSAIPKFRQDSMVFIKAR